MPWGWIFAQIIGDRATKIAKIMVVHWHLIFLRWGKVCFPMHLYGHHTFVWEKCWEFQTTSSQKPLCQCYSNIMWSLLGAGKWKVAKMVMVHWPRWPTCPYMVKTFKNHLQQRMPWGWIFAQVIRDGRSIKLVKMIFVHWCSTFLRQGQVCFRMHLFGPYTFEWKKWW